jgi:hypothetical protein
MADAAVPRTPGVEQPSDAEVLLSGPFKVGKRTFRTQAYGYSGGKPTKDLGEAPKGLLMLMDAGVVFLCAGGRGGRSAGQVFTELVDEVSEQVLGPVAAALSWGLAKVAVTNARENAQLGDFVRKALEHPSSWIVPYPQIVSADTHKEGSSWTSFTLPRFFFSFDREQDDGTRLRYHLCAVDRKERIDSWAAAVIAGRFAFEREQLFYRRIDALLPGFRTATLQAELVKLGDRHGDKARKHVEEAAAAYVGQMKVALAAQGADLDALLEDAKHDLRHFAVFPGLEVLAADRPTPPPDGPAP